jgi:UDP-N-acetylmuramate: L-alanyl-gamma-D-glutamyl-meso-diaminopimelate ligase
LERGCWTAVELVGVDAGWRACDPAPDGSFEVRLHGKVVGAVRWNLLGEYNRANALAALAAARHVGVPVGAGIAALASFKNVKRRMEVRGVVNGVTVYDDFAHHPTAIGLTVAGLRAKVGKARILAVLEPRSYTMKLGVMKDSLAPSLSNADLVFCYTNGIGWDAQAALSSLGAKAASFDDLSQLVRSVVDAAQPGDHVLVMSNGGFGGVHGKLLNALAGQSA